MSDINFNRVRRLLLWQDGDYRMVRYLIVYGGGDGTWEAPYYTKPELYWEVQHRVKGGWPWQQDNEGYSWQPVWDARNLKGYSQHAYLWGDKTKRYKITRDMAQRGKDWVQNHLKLLAKPVWEIRGDSVDGEGTRCPLKRDNGKCTVTRWFYDGYSGGSDSPVCPGPCLAPKYQRVFPFGVDDRGNTIKYYANLLREKNGESMDLF